MPCPHNCPEKLYDIALECWKDEPDERPTFDTLQWILEEFFSEGMTDVGYRDLDDMPANH